MSRIAIVGAYGMVGTAFRKENKNVIPLALHDCDITKPHSILRMLDIYEPDVIINSGVINSFEPCAKNPELAYEVNSLGPLNLAKICRDRDITLVQLSTVNIFDGTAMEPYTEKDIPNPLSIYGKSKYIAELYVNSICPRYYIIRMPTMFGHIEREENIGFPEKMLRAIRDGKKIKVANDKIESISHTRDIAKKVYRILEDKESYGIYHVFNEGCISFYEFVVEMADQLGKRIDNIEIGSHRDFDNWETKPKYVPMESIKIGPLRPWYEALRDYLDEQNII